MSDHPTFLESDNSHQVKKAKKALQRAKEIEQNRLANGWKYKRENNTIRLIKIKK